MTLRQTLAELKRLGTAQNRKVYGRHGVGSAMYGVSYANQAKKARSYVRGQSKTSSKPGKTAKASKTGSRRSS